jgi:hypothetical protein
MWLPFLEIQKSGCNFLDFWFISIRVVGVLEVMGSWGASKIYVMVTIMSVSSIW